MTAHNVPLADRNRMRLALLAVSITALAASAAWFLAGVARLSETSVVMSVMVTAFVCSWLVTNVRAPRRAASAHRHLTLVPVYDTRR